MQIDQDDENEMKKGKLIISLSEIKLRDDECNFVEK